MKRKALFCNRLKELRIEAGLSQQKLAEKTGIPSASIAHWELNARIPNLDAVIVLAEFFKVSVGFMAGVED